MDARYAAIVAGLVALIVYGSLYPFQFHTRPGPVGPLDHLLATCRHGMNRGDLISNVLLYVPLGIFTARSLRGRWPGAAVLFATLFGLLISTTIELTQFYDLTRSSDLCDTYANAAGAFLGAASGSFLRRDRFPQIHWRPFAILLLATWIADALFPYFQPAQAFRHASFQEILRSSRFPLRFLPMDLFAQVVFWLAAAMLLDALLGASRSRWLLPLLTVAVLLARLVNAVLSPVDVAGGAISAVAWLVLSKFPFRAPLIAILFLAYAILQALEPFTFLAHPRPFGWIPFLSFMDGPRYSGTRVFLEKSFTYGALLWLWVQAGLSWTLTTISVITLEFSLRLAQTYLPGRSAEVTDAIMALILAIVMNLMQEPRSLRKLD